MSFNLKILLASIAIILQVSAKYVPFLEQGFYFDYNRPWEPVPVPVTEQCETIHLVWGRRTATGPNPTAPYYLQVYASTFISPFIIPVGSGLTYDWDVPFAPGTLYQICMFDKNGVTGGCQDTYTVVQNLTASLPKCQNVTAAPPLEVVATVPNGPFSQFGWIDQCTDLTVTPKSGNPPFTLTVAPALHPPYNITSNTMDPIDWTVSLSWSSAFFISLVSSDGKTWSNGPLHSGGLGPTGCLSPGTISRNVAVGAGVGGAIAGVVAGLLGCLLFSAMKKRRQRRADNIMGAPPPEYEIHHALSDFPTPLATPEAQIQPVDSARSGFFSIIRRGTSRGTHVMPYTVSRQAIVTRSETKIPTPQAVSPSSTMASPCTLQTPGDGISPSTESSPIHTQSLRKSPKGPRYLNQ